MNRSALYVASLVMLVSVVVGTVLTPLALCGFTNQSPYNSICQITVGGGQGSGTLIAISDGQALILCCRHVAEHVDAAAKIEWLAADRQMTVGSVIAIVPGTTFNNDLSLIVGDAPKGIQPVRIAKFDPLNGPWRCVGFRGGNMYEAIADEASENDSVIKFNSPLVQGQSGGAILDRNDCVVGVTVGSDLETYGLAADGKYLATLIAAHSK